MKSLIISDNRLGHLNQSEAFCKLKDLKYDILEVKYNNKAFKALSYLLDFLGIYIEIFTCNKKINNSYDIVVCTGSSTYYPAKYFAKKLNAKTVATMLPKGYKKNFDLIFVMQHDYKKEIKNAKVLPVNLNYSEIKNYYNPKKKAIGIIIGGENKTYKMPISEIKNILINIKNSFKDYEIAITTSPRTSKEIESFIENYDLDYKVIFSKNPINPISDFLLYCDFVFITQDSTSMISQGVCFGKAGINIIKLQSKNKNKKYESFISNLVKNEYANIFENEAKKTKKLDLKSLIQEIKI